MSLFGALMGDVEDDPFFGSHMRHMRQMNNMMNSLVSDPFGMLGGGMFPLMPRHSTSLMPFMPQMPSLNRLMSNDHMSAGSSFSSSTVVMSSGPNGKPQVYSQSSSTKIGPNGVKETRSTLQDSRTGTKKMAIGHHIGSRAHVIEREHNLYSGDAEERQEFINLDEEEAEEFDREFQQKAGAFRPRTAIGSGARHHERAERHHERAERGERYERAERLALPAPPSPTSTASSSANLNAGNSSSGRRPSARRPLRPAVCALTLPTSASVRETYGGAHPQRHRHKQYKHRPQHDH